MKNSKLGKYIYLTLFAILYLSVALVSTLHAISFFGLANSPILATILAITFEVGQAAVLFSILTSPSERNKVMPWVLMGILTLVQILGNIFSSYKYLISNSIDSLRFFKEPVFVWTSLPDEQTTVILTYIVGSILPIVALCLTSMVTNYLGDENKTEENEVKEVIKEVEKIVEDPKQSERISELEDQLKELESREPEVKEVIKEVEKIVERPVEDPEQQKRISELEAKLKEYEESKAAEEATRQPIEQKNKMKSHFVNL